MAYDLSLLSSFGTDVYISESVEIRRPHLVKIGSHIAIDTGFYITTKAKIGDYVHIAPYCTIIGGENAFFQMGNFSGMAAGCRIICASDDYLGSGLIGPTIPNEFHADIICAPVVIQDFVTLGTNVVVMPGIKIGEGSVIGAGSLVTKDVEPWSVYLGTPARRLKERNSEIILAHARKLGYR